LASVKFYCSIIDKKRPINNKKLQSFLSYHFNLALTQVSVNLLTMENTLFGLFNYLAMKIRGFRLIEFHLIEKTIWTIDRKNVLLDI
jgi:hypothetical protein